MLYLVSNNPAPIDESEMTIDQLIAHFEMIDPIADAIASRITNASPDALNALYEYYETLTDRLAANDA